MSIDLERLSPTQLRTLMHNAEQKGARETFRSAFRELCLREGRDADDPLDREMFAAIAALEEIRYTESGKRRPANYTRRKLANKGVYATLVDWAKHPTSTTGFDLLIAHGLHDLTGEAIVLRHKLRFPQDVIKAARKRLANVGVVID